MSAYVCARGSQRRYSEVKGSYKWFVFLATWGLSLTGRSLMHTKCTHMLTDNLNCVMWERHFATLNADLRPGVPCGINTFLIPSFHPRQREREGDSGGDSQEGGWTGTAGRKRWKTREKERTESACRRRETPADRIVCCAEITGSASLKNIPAGKRS